MPKVKQADAGGKPMLRFMCPGCEEAHVVGIGPGSPSWQWNGDVEKPTLSPSVLIRSGHYAPHHRGECWCDYNKEHVDDPAPFKCGICHSFVRDGKIQFLSDCTHELAGKTVDLPEIEE